MKIDNEFLKNYVIVSAVAIMVLIAGMIYLGVTLQNMSKIVNDTNKTVQKQPDPSQIDSIGQAVQDNGNGIREITNVVHNICDANPDCQ
jgi:uncharacterized protein YoxC